MNLLTKQKETHRLRKQTYDCQGERIGTLGRSCTHCYILNGEPTKTYCLAYGTLLSVTCQPGWVRVWGKMGTCMCVAESLCRSPETATTLLISSTPIQNKKLNVWGKIDKGKN